MKKIYKILLLWTALFLPALAYSQNDIETDINGNCGIMRKVAIYGKDDREEYCAQNIIIRELANSVAALFADDGESIVKVGKYYRFGTRTLSQKHRVAQNQRFADQPAEAFCSGFLVGDDLLATAGHCIKDNPLDNSDHEKPGCRENTWKGRYCKDIKIVFGYRKELGGFIPKGVSENNVYSCIKVIAHSMASGPDYAIIKLDRKVNGREPLAINRKNNLTKGTKIFVIGHPSGLPLKIANNAEVIAINETRQIMIRGVRKEWINKNYSFLANLDTFAGNSGSPVINAKTLLVEGILVAGDLDYIKNPDDPFTYVVSTYPHIPSSDIYTEGVGEVVTKISVVAKFIPQNQIEEDMLKMNEETNGNLYETMMKYLKEYKKQYQRDNRIIPIPNFTPDGERTPQLEPAIYYVPDVPKPTQLVEI